MDKIQELTDKLYSEGVKKGADEAEKIILEAEEKSAQIIKDATRQAEQSIEEANRKTEEIKNNAQAELKLYASQALEALKTEIVNVVTDNLATSNVKAAMQDKAYMQKLIADLMQNWSENKTMTVGVENKEELEQYIESNVKSLLDNKLKIETVNGVKTGFVISPEDGSYKVKFGEDEFVEYFKEFLRPQIQKLLF